VERSSTKTPRQNITSAPIRYGWLRKLNFMPEAPISLTPDHRLAEMNALLVHSPPAQVFGETAYSADRKATRSLCSWAVSPIEKFWL
jgi:hypothetical protein